MSMKYLGDQLDIHCGGIDHVNIHHTNEIAQSEAATGKKFFNYWLHGKFLILAGGVKMAKSDENFLTLENAFIKQGLDPLVYRFAAFQTHYRKVMEYSDKSILAAKNGLEHLYNQIRNLGTKKGKVNKDFKEKFLEAINDDLNMPQALAVIQQVLKSDLKDADKLATVLDFDKVLGLDLAKLKKEKIKLPKEIQNLVKQREKARAEKDWQKADQFREKIAKAGYLIEDTPKGAIIKKK